MPSGLVALLDDIAVIAKVAAASIDDVGLAAAKDQRMVYGTLRRSKAF